jgi:hypothetical protein
MIRALRVLLVLVAFVFVLYVGVSLSLMRYDATTKRHLLGAIARELPSRSSYEVMTDFMRRHTTRFALDDVARHEYVGLVAQTRLDRILERKVEIVLKVDENRALAGSEIRIFYTVL